LTGEFSSTARSPYSRAAFELSTTTCKANHTTMLYQLERLRIKFRGGLSNYVFHAAELNDNLHQLRSALFWDITRRRVVVVYRLLEERVGPIFKGQESEKKHCPQTSLRDYHTTPRNIPDKGRAHQQRGGSLKSMTSSAVHTGQICGSPSGAAEDSSLLGYDAVSMGLSHNLCFECPKLAHYSPKLREPPTSSTRSYDPEDVTLHPSIILPSRTAFRG
jgi:hypothetical protein